MAPKRDINPVIQQTPDTIRGHIRALIFLMLSEENRVDLQPRRLQRIDLGMDMREREGHILDAIYSCADTDIPPTAGNVARLLEINRRLGEIDAREYIATLAQEHAEETSGIRALSAFIGMWVQEQQLASQGDMIRQIANDPFMDYGDKWDASFNLLMKVSPTDGFIAEPMSEREFMELTLLDNQRVIQARKEGRDLGPMLPWESAKAYFEYLEWGQASLLLAREGRGKAQPLDAKVLTPSGWKCMGDIYVGDKVVNPDGGFSKVIGVYPQGAKPIYRVTMKDGSSTECCEDHLWKVQSVSTRHNSKKWSVKPLKELMGPSPYKDGRPQWYIPMASEIDFLSRNQSVDPYLLGLLLGDGNLTNETPIISTADEEILEWVKRLVPAEITPKHISRYDYRLSADEYFRDFKSDSNPLAVALRDLGLMGKNSATKFIPNEYKFSGKSQRIALLQGLFDSDGYCHEGRAVDYLTISSRLAKDLCEVVQSLGGTAKIANKQPTFTYKGVKKLGAPAFRIRVKLPHPINPFRLSRKAESYRTEGWYQPYRSIKSVEFVGVKPAQCIQLNSDNQLYVTDDFIVTHNTTAIQHIGEHISWKQKLKTDFCHISVETPELVLSRRQFCRYNQIPYNDVKNGLVDLCDTTWKPRWDAWMASKSNKGNDYGYIINLFSPDASAIDIITAMVRASEVSRSLGRRIVFAIDHLHKINWSKTHSKSGEFEALRSIGIMLTAAASKLSVKNPNHLFIVAQEGDEKGQMFGGKFAAKIAQNVFSLERERFGPQLPDGSYPKAEESLMMCYAPSVLTEAQKKSQWFQKDSKGNYTVIDALGKPRYWHKRGDDFKHISYLRSTKGNDNANFTSNLLFEAEMSRLVQDPEQIKQMRKDNLLPPLQVKS